MEQELKDFIKNWRVDFVTESAEHVSGLKFRHISQGIDGQEKIEIANLPQWTRRCIEQGDTIEQCERKQAQLYNEFVDIYKNVIVARQNAFQKSVGSHTK